MDRTPTPLARRRRPPLPPRPQRDARRPRTPTFRTVSAPRGSPGSAPSRLETRHPETPRARHEESADNEVVRRCVGLPLQPDFSTVSRRLLVNRAKRACGADALPRGVHGTLDAAGASLLLVQVTPETPSRPAPWAFRNPGCPGAFRAVLKTGKAPRRCQACRDAQWRMRRIAREAKRLRGKPPEEIERTVACSKYADSPELVRSVLGVKRRKLNAEKQRRRRLIRKLLETQGASADTPDESAAVTSTLQAAEDLLRRAFPNPEDDLSRELIETMLTNAERLASGCSRSAFRWER